MKSRDNENIKRKREAMARARIRSRVAVVGCLIAGMAGGALIGQALAATEVPHYVDKPVPWVADPLPVLPPEEEPEPEQPQPLPCLGEFKVSHYCACELCCGDYSDGYTSTGTVATEGRTIAVDPDVIPYGTEVVLLYSDGTVGHYIAEDCGGSIKDNRIDVYMDNHKDALAAGIKTAEVYIVEEVKE